MTNVLVLLSIIFIIIIFIRFHTSIKKLLNKFNKNSKDSIIILILTILVYMIIFLLQDLDNSYNIIPDINVIKSRTNQFIRIYIPLFIVFEFIRYKAKNCNNIFKVIIIDMIFGEKILFNFFFYVLFIGLFHYRYNILGPEISDKASNIINTIQTLIVTFFISLNFTEGYNKTKAEKKWLLYKPRILEMYLICLEKVLDTIRSSNLYIETNFSNDYMDIEGYRQDKEFEIYQNYKRHQDSERFQKNKIQYSLNTLQKYISILDKIKQDKKTSLLDEKNIKAFYDGIIDIKTNFTNLFDFIINQTVCDNEILSLNAIILEFDFFQENFLKKYILLEEIDLQNKIEIELKLLKKIKGLIIH